MPISKSLHVDSIDLGAQLSNSDEVLERIAELVAKSPLAASLRAKDVHRALVEREQLSSTGLGHGLAIPHCAVDGIEDFVVGLLTTKAPIDFRSMDGQPTDLFFFIVGPPQERNRHIKLLSAISKFVSQAANAERLRESDDRSAVRDLLVEQLAYDEGVVSREKVLFEIFVQNMDCFEDLLNLLSSVVPGSISVIETRNAGAYLFSMPLFAAFWSEKSEQEGRIILAVAEKELTNSVIRQIQEVTGDPDSTTGIMVTVHPLTYVAGSLNF